MLQILRNNPIAALISLLMHVVIVLFMVVGVDWLEKPVQPRSGVEVVQARIIDQKQVAAEVERLKQADLQRKQQQQSEQQRLEDLKQQQNREQQRLDELKQQREREQRQLAAEKQLAEEKQRQAKTAAEQQRQAELEKQRKVKAETKRKAEAAKREKAAAEKKHKAEAEKQRKAEAKKRQKAEAEKKRKADVEKKRKAAAEKQRKAEAEKRRKAEAEKKRKAEAARKQREAELAAALQAERDAGEISRYAGLIQQKVARNWVRLEGTGKGLKCTLQVRLSGDGSVLTVAVTKSSGNATFDRSAVNAVYKADPLPLPKGKLLQKFRVFNFVFDPTKK